MAVSESLEDYRRRSDSSEDEGSEDSHDTGGGEEVSPNTAKRERQGTLHLRGQGQGETKGIYAKVEVLPMRWFASSKEMP